VTDVHAAAGERIVNTATLTAGTTDGSVPDDTASGTVPGGSDTDSGNGDSGTDLPGTGGVPFAWLALGVLFVATGCGVLWAARRRRS
jgi:hypothetical protein